MAAESTVPQLVDKKGDDIMELVISCETSKATWTDLVHSFEGPSNTMENRIMDLKLEYQTFRVKPSESLSQTYTRYKTQLNELANDGVNLSKHEINVGFVNSLPKKWLTFSQGLRNANHTQTLDHVDIYGSQHEPKIQKDYKTKYKKMKAKLALLEASPSTSQNPKTYQSKNKGLVVETFDWDEEEVSDDEEMTQVKVLMALADDELTVGKNHARNGEWIDITMKKVNILLFMDEAVDWQNYLKYINVDLNEQIPNQKKKILRGELLTEFSSKKDVNENLFIPASMGYDHEMVPKSKDCVESTTLTANFQTLILGASPSSEVMSLTYQPHSLKGEKPCLGFMKHIKPETQESSSKSVLGPVTIIDTEPMLMDEKINSKTHKQKPESSNSGSSSKILKEKVKPFPQPFPPCTQCNFNDYRPDNYRNYPKCEIYGSYDHFTSRHNRVILVRGGALAESSQYSESSIGVRPQKPDSPPKSRFTRETNPSLIFIQRHIMKPIWYLESGYSRSMIGVKSYLHKYVEKPCPKVVFGDNLSCITEGYGSINRGGIIFSKVAFVNGIKYNLISISQLCDAKYIVQFNDKKGTIFNANKEIVLITPRRNDVYVLDMSSLTLNEARFFVKAS
ncbi:hypothetical protein Tco_0058647 [Tanacetum coccineum]